MKNILNELQHGRIPGWDSRINTRSLETDAIWEKIKAEKHYFSAVLSKSDFERFEKLNSLHKEIHAIRYKKIYENAFRLGVMLICAVFMGEEP